MIKSLAHFCLSLLVGMAMCHGETESLIPSSKLRPSDSSRFDSALVKIRPPDVQAIESSLSNELKKRYDIPLLVLEGKLGALLPDASSFVPLLDAASLNAREWTLRTLGEYQRDKSAAVPRLLRMVADPLESDLFRALAARILGTTRMDESTIAGLIKQLDRTGNELQAALLEVLGKSGQTGIPFIPELRRYLDAPHGDVQFFAFCTIRQIEQTSGAPRNESHTNEAYANACRLATIPPSAKSTADASTLALAVLQQTQSPKYLVCIALQHLTNSGANPSAVQVVVRKLGDDDEFISNLAANVLDRFGAIDSRGIAVLSAALSHSNSFVRFRLASRLQRQGRHAANATDSLLAALSRAATQGAPPREVGAYLDVLRAIGTNAVSPGDVLVRMLVEDSPIYRNAGKDEVDRLRGFLFITLEEVGVPKKSLPFILSSLANADAGSSHEFAGAARAAGALGTEAREAIPFLLRPLKEVMILRQRLMAFENFGSQTTSTREYTTCQIEALRALRRIGQTDQSAIQAVRTFLEQAPPILDSPLHVNRVPNLRAEATKTLAAIERRNGLNE